jgi:5'-nucleotidase
VTALDVHEMLPFANTLILVELSGSQLEEVVQRNADAEVTGDHGILQVSGLSYVFHATGDETGATVVEISVGGEPLDPARSYRVAMPDYVALMSAVYLGVELPPWQDLGVFLAPVVVEAVQTRQRISPAAGGRIRRLD